MNGKDHMTDEEYEEIRMKVLSWGAKRGMPDVEDLLHEAYFKYVKAENKPDISISWWFRVIQNMYFKRYQKDKHIQDEKKVRNIIAMRQSKDWEDIERRATQLKQDMIGLPDFVIDITFLCYLGNNTREQTGEIMGCNGYKVNNELHRGLKDFKDEQNQDQEG